MSKIDSRYVSRHVLFTANARKLGAFLATQLLVHAFKPKYIPYDEAAESSVLIKLLSLQWYAH